VPHATDAPTTDLHTADPADLGAQAERLRDLEGLFARMRAAASVRGNGEATRAEGGLHLFATSITNRRAWAADVTHEPGVFPVGETWVGFRVRVGADTGTRATWTTEVEGRFAIVVTDDGNTDVPAAMWTARTFDGEIIDARDVPWYGQLPRSVLVPKLAGPRLARAIGRVVYDGEEARSELLRTQRGLVHKIVSQYRRQLEQLLELASRRYAAPASQRPTTAAWSKVAMREVGNAIKAEIASVTGISIEFRQLISWFRTHPGDRARDAVDVSRDMAIEAGITRLIQAHLAPGREGGARLLDEMLADGRAIYVPAGADTSIKVNARAEGLFVVSPRSSLAEIERAQRHADVPGVSLDAAVHAGSDTTVADLWLVDVGEEYEEVDVRLFLHASLADRGLSDLEAAVWCARTGALSTADELPEIANDLGLEGRAEARAALRRAWRKLDSLGEELRQAIA
jgi:hypothetical protein